MILFLLLFVEVALSLSQMHKMQERLAQVVEEYSARGALAQEMHQSSRERAILLHAMISTDDPFERDDLLVDLRALGSRFLKAREQIAAMTLSKDERDLLQQQRELSRAAGALQYQVIDLLAQDQLAEAKRVLLHQAIPAQERALAVVQNFAALQQSQNRAALAATSEEFHQADHLLLIIGGVTLLLSALVAGFVLHRTNAMMAALTHSNAELLDARERLEERVAERTADLRRVNEKLLDEVNERKRAERQLAFMATHDDLTELPNRALFNDHLAKSIARARRAGTRLALLFVDLDGFKQINDSHGHADGDHVLREVACRLKSRGREQDLVARLGGDEFALILEHIYQPADAGAVARKVIEAVSEPITVAETKHQVGASIGIALFPDDAKNLNELVRLADNAMYCVKRSGKGNYRYHQAPRLASAAEALPFQW
ncbi:diguanylate cyclase domain-containing protein [Thiorhodovibrio litoralis]|uniref:diguanylate cyclase domain-containing protein n=1 Tax=Thiorhodovibrio litoralis TaxID=2952932 RepID=UPI002B25848C|nr:diguanylate cyclase [Thiorhodovibrio litoralis]